MPGRRCPSQCLLVLAPRDVCFTWHDGWAVEWRQPAWFIRINRKSSKGTLDELVNIFLCFIFKIYHLCWMTNPEGWLVYLQKKMSVLTRHLLIYYLILPTVLHIKTVCIVSCEHDRQETSVFPQSPVKHTVALVQVQCLPFRWNPNLFIRVHSSSILKEN